MFCPQCGSKLPDGAAFCGECGASVKARVDAGVSTDAAPASAAAPAPAAAAPVANVDAPGASASQASAAESGQTYTTPAANAGVPGSAPAPAPAAGVSSVDLLTVFFEHKKKFAIGGGVLVALIAVALFLTPSGNTTTSTTSASLTTGDDSTETVQVTKATKVPLSQALSKKGVWFWSSSGSGISSSTSGLHFALVFDGKGNVTEYYTTGLTAASLKGKSTDEIIKLVKKADKDWFKKGQQEKVVYYTGEITSTKKRIAAIQNGTSSGDESRYTEDLNKYQEAIKQVKALKYEAPSANPFSLHIVTGADGKSTNTETIQLTAFEDRYITVRTNDSSQANGVSAEYVCSEEARQIEFTESSSSGVSSFSGMSFRQFGSLTKLLDDGVNEQYVLDKSTAKGVIVDI